MHIKLFKRFLFFFIFYLSTYLLHSSLVDAPVNAMRIPSRDSYLKNLEYLTPFKKKRITPAEYVTDPLIMYASLWGCFFLTLPLWETNKNVWAQDGDRGFDKLNDYLDNGTDVRYDSVLKRNVDQTFANRLQFEPFATGRADPVMKEWNGISVFRGDMYAKNIVEPVYFTFLALYMRSKDYHPAIMVTEIILLSLIYELTIRPFWMNASFEQFIKNPAIAISVGFLFDEISTYLLSTPYIGLHVLALIFNPFNSLPNSRIHPMLFFDPYRKSATISAEVKF
jgi:hypothetical protein